MLTRPASRPAVIAVAGVLLTQDWFYYFLHGTSETMLIGCYAVGGGPDRRGQAGPGVGG